MTALDVTFLRPLWLLTLPVLAVAGWWLHSRRGRIGAWHKVTAPVLMQAMTALGLVTARGCRARLWSALGVAAIAGLALSGPAIERRDRLSYRNLDGVMLVLDASKGTTGDRRWPQLITMARVAVTALGSRPSGLIVYGGDAYVATDLTVDHVQLGQTVSLIDATTVPDPGSRPARALDLALRTMRDASLLSGDVLLLTDGKGLGPKSLAVAGSLARRDLRLSIVSLTRPGPEITALAAVGGGKVFTLDQTVALAAWLGDAARTKLVRQDFPMLFWSDYGRFLLALSLVPMLGLFRRPAA